MVNLTLLSYGVPCTCGKVYIDENKLWLETHKDTCAKCLTDVSHSLDERPHPINWDGTKVLNRASRNMQLVLKGVLSKHATPEDARFNGDRGYKLPDCWIATYNKMRGRAGFSSARRGAQPSQLCLSRL